MRALLCNILAILLITSAHPSFAQEGDPGERLLEQQIRREQLEGLAGSQAGQEIKTPDVAGVIQEDICFPIHTIHLAGMSVFKEGSFDGLVAEFAGQCLGQASIGNLLQRISGIYADKGYITTRAYVPAQDIASRELTIEVLEGKMEAFIYQQVDKDGNPHPGNARKLKSAMPLQAGDVFQLRDLEHGLEQINRLRSSQANANLVAGQEPGTSRVVVTEQKVDTVRGTFGINNRGDEVTGETQISLSLEADDLLRLNDTYFLSYSGARNSNALAFSLSVPYRKWLFAANGSYSESLSPVSATSDLFTQTANLNFTAERLLFRDARSKYFLYGGVHSYWNERFVNIAALAPQQRTALSIGLRHEHRLEKAVISANTSLTFGAPFLGGDENLSPLTSATPRSEFTKLETRLTYIRPFESGQQLTATLVGQLSDNPLFSNEQLSIGGWETVRGYAGHSFSGDSGAFLRTELSFPTKALDFRRLGAPLEGTWLLNPVKNAQGGFRPFVFFDVGYAKARASRLSATMISTGFGFSSQVGLSTLNGSLAVPLSDRHGQSAGSIQAYLGFTVKLF